MFPSEKSPFPVSFLSILALEQKNIINQTYNSILIYIFHPYYSCSTFICFANKDTCNRVTTNAPQPPLLWGCTSGFSVRTCHPSEPPEHPRVGKPSETRPFWKGVRNRFWHQYHVILNGKFWYGNYNKSSPKSLAFPDYQGRAFLTKTKTATFASNEPRSRCCT